jgi:hypothetical protein
MITRDGKTNQPTNQPPPC